MDEKNNQIRTDNLTKQNITDIQTTQITTDANDNQKKKKKEILIIVSSIITLLVILFLIIQFINFGGFSGMKVRKTWNQIESFLNQHTDDNFKIVSQNGDMLKISFDNTGKIDFSCWQPSIFNMGYSSGLRCTFKFYFDDGTTDRLGRYYLLKNLQKVDTLIENDPDISIVDKRFNDYRRISFNDEGQLKSFFYKLIEIEDFQNMWKIYKDIVVTNGKIEETQSVKENNPINILDPNGIYLNLKIHNYYDHALSDYKSLFDYAYEHNW